MRNYRNTVAWRYIIGLPLLIIILVGIFVLAKPNHQSAISKNGLGVVAAENFWGNIASQIGGKHVHVLSIITDPSADPHLYESSAKDASAVSSAHIVIVNGLGYDDFMNKLLGTTKNKPQVLSASQILNVTAPGANPHLWYDIPRVNFVAAQIAKAYEAKDSINKSDYEHNLSLFNQSLQPLLNTISQIKVHFQGTPVAYTEPVPGYMLAAAGLSVKTPESFAKAVEDGNDPSPADTQTMTNIIATKQVKVLLYNSQATSPVTQQIRNLANQVGIPVVAVSETLPSNEATYQSWQQNQLNELLKTLERG